MTIGHHSRPLLRWAPALAFLLLLPAVPARAQEVLGPAECIRCHNHSLQAERWQKREVEQFGRKAHFNTLAQLRLPEAQKIARLAGLRPDDARCVACHGTAVRGRPRAGVSCESCHGPGSKYNEPHQKPDQYALSVSLGMADLRVKPANIVEVCVRCHVTVDGDLRDAGHPAGEKFEVAASLAKIEHWVWEKRRTVIDMKEIDRLGRAAVARQVAKIPPPKPRAEGAAAEAATPAASGRGLDPAAAQPLPDDYTEPAVAEPGGDFDLPAFDAAGPAATSAGSPFAAARAAQGGAAGERKPAPRSRLALRQEALKLLLEAARAGRGAGTFTPGEYGGPDSELLRLQDELFGLALRPAPAATPTPAASPGGTP